MTSARSHIADSLGLCRPPPGQSIPIVRGARSVAAAERRDVIPARQQLSIFGDRDEMIYFRCVYVYLLVVMKLYTVNMCLCEFAITLKDEFSTAPY